MPASTENSRTGRSVLDFQSTDEVIKALGSMKIQNKEPSDWILSSSEEHTSLYELQSTEKEASRLAVLRDYKLLETPAEDTLDEITKETAKRFEASWALISLVDMGRQWFKSTYNTDRVLGVAETARQHAFCAHTIQQKKTPQDEDDIFEVPDALEDSRFAANPLVTGEHPGLRFYAAVPLTVPEGVRLGTLCVLDRTPRPNGLSMQERSDLKGLAGKVVEALVTRKETLDKAAGAKQQQELGSGGDGCASLEEDSSTMPRSSSKHAMTESDDGSAEASSAEVKKCRLRSPKASPKTGTDDSELISKPPASVSLPDPKTDGMDPDTYLSKLVEAMYGVKMQLKTGLELDDYFPRITDEQTSAYSMEVVTMARNNNAEGLRQIYQAKGREALDCFNRFGEGLLNLCCRRGFTECVEVLLSEEVHLNVRVRDDFGRTPLHDTCWNPEPLTNICKKLIEQDPSLFFITDKRGFTAFQYARQTDWPLWRQFLLDNRHLLAPLASPEIQKRFS